jgi:hypothetical protein
MTDDGPGREWVQFQRESSGPSMIATVAGSRVAFVSDRAVAGEPVPSPRCGWKIWPLGLSGGADSLADGVAAVEAAFDEAQAGDA